MFVWGSEIPLVSLVSSSSINVKYNYIEYFQKSPILQKYSYPPLRLETPDRNIIWMIGFGWEGGFSFYLLYFSVFFAY